MTSDEARPSRRQSLALNPSTTRLEPPDALAEVPRLSATTLVKRRLGKPAVRVPLTTTDRVVEELAQLPDDNAQRVLGQAAVGATAGHVLEQARLDLEEVVEVRVGLVVHVPAARELQDGLVGARGGARVVVDGQVLDLHLPGASAAAVLLLHRLVVLALLALAAEGRDLQAARDLLAVVAHVRVPNDRRVPAGVLVDVRLSPQLAGLPKDAASQ